MVGRFVYILPTQPQPVVLLPGFRHRYRFRTAEFVFIVLFRYKRVFMPNGIERYHVFQCLIFIFALLRRYFGKTFAFSFCLANFALAHHAGSPCG